MFNFGFSQPLCHDVALGVGELTLRCPVGQIGQVTSFGVTPAEASILDACEPNEETIKCYGMYDLCGQPAGDSRSLNTTSHSLLRLHICHAIGIFTDFDLVSRIVGSMVAGQ